MGSFGVMGAYTGILLRLFFIFAPYAVIVF